MPFQKYMKVASHSSILNLVLVEVQFEEEEHCMVLQEQEWVVEKMFALLCCCFHSTSSPTWKVGSKVNIIIAFHL